MLKVDKKESKMAHNSDIESCEDHRTGIEKTQDRVQKEQLIAPFKQKEADVIKGIVLEAINESDKIETMNKNIKGIKTTLTAMQTSLKELSGKD